MRYFTWVRIPHPFDTDTLPANVKAALAGVNLLPVHGKIKAEFWDVGGNYIGPQPIIPAVHLTWPTIPGTRIYQGKRLVSFAVDTDEAGFQSILDNDLPTFEIVAYREELYTPDPLSTDEVPLPPRAAHSRKPSTADLINWMADEYDNQDPPQPVRPTELRMNMVQGTGPWVIVS